MRLLLEQAETIMFEIIAKRAGLSVHDWLLSLGRAEVERSTSADVMAEFGQRVWKESQVRSALPVSSPSESVTPSKTKEVESLTVGQVRCIHCLAYKEPGAFPSEVEFGLEVCLDCKEDFEVALHGSVGQRPVFKGVVCQKCQVEKGRNAFFSGSEICRKCLGKNKSGIKRNKCSKCHIEKGVSAFNAGRSICRKCENKPDVSEIEPEVVPSVSGETQECVRCGSEVAVPAGHDELVICLVCEEKVEMELSEEMRQS